MDNKYYDFPFYKWEKEKANDPFLDSHLVIIGKNILGVKLE